MAQGGFVRGPQDYTRGLTRFERFLPAGCTEAPPIARPQAAKTEFRSRCRKIIATRLGKLEKRGSHDGADRVTAEVLSTGVAAAVSKKARHRLYRANFETITEHITGAAPFTTPMTTVFPPHCLVSIAPIAPHFGTPGAISPAVAKE